MSASDYRTLLTELDAWFAQGRAATGGLVPCAGGCTACCHGPFDISVADAELIDDAVRHMPPDERVRVASRAASLLGRMRALAPDWEPPYAVDALGEDRFDRLTDALADEPCPLLDERGRCGIYADRPLVCRMIGLGLRTPSGRTVDNACPIQARFPGYGELPPAMFDLETFEAHEHRHLREAAARQLGSADRWEFETTIAAVVARHAKPGPTDSP